MKPFLHGILRAPLAADGVSCTKTATQPSLRSDRLWAFVGFYFPRALRVTVAPMKLERSSRLEFLLKLAHGGIVISRQSYETSRADNRRHGALTFDTRSVWNSLLSLSRPASFNRNFMHTVLDAGKRYAYGVYRYFSTSLVQVVFKIGRLRQATSSLSHKLHDRTD